MTRKERFEQILRTFPTSVRKYVETIPENRGMLADGPCRTILDSLKLSVEELMLQLLPVSRLYSSTFISGFQVGAVVKAKASDESDEAALFLGANVEFPGQALSQTIHAEQSAVINAWLQEGARQIEMIAVTAAPCGCCRQFLYELQNSQHLTILLQDQPEDQPVLFNLPAFLPHAFGPRDLEVEGGLTAPQLQLPEFRLASSSEDKLVQVALASARRSYAPYSQNFAGCTIQTENDRIYTGPYAENAAFNPSLSPLHTAIICMIMDNLESDSKIKRAVLVEKPTAINQRGVCEQLLQSVVPDVVLEYHEAE